MQQKENNLKAHLIIRTSCTYQLPDQSTSNEELAINIRKNLKNRCREQFSKEHVRVSAATCLGHCDEGIAAVLYPSCKWFTQIRPENEDQLFQEVEQLLK